MYYAITAKNVELHLTAEQRSQLEQGMRTTISLELLQDISEPFDEFVTAQTYLLAREGGWICTDSNMEAAQIS